MRRHFTVAMVLWVGAVAALADQGQPASDEARQGFVTLFDGKSLAGWQGSTKGYTIENGLLVCQKRGCGRLYTVKEYADFVFRFEFKLEPGANNGVGIRMPGPEVGDPAFVGMEIQILDDTSPKYAKLKEYQYHGSIYGVVPAKRGHLKPVGEWNAQEIRCQGGRIQITLNGAVIVDADISQIDPKNTIDHRPHPGLKRTKGFIGFLGHGAQIEFRNIRVKEL